MPKPNQTSQTHFVTLFLLVSDTNLLWNRLQTASTSFCMQIELGLRLSEGFLKCAKNHKGKSRYVVIYVCELA